VIQQNYPELTELILTTENDMIAAVEVELVQSDE
jgi:hypothetical protein